MNDPIVFLLLIHFLADFALQTNDQAVNKSSSNLFLFYHVASYSAIWTVAMIPFLHNYLFLVFGGVTFVCHFITDFFTSRLVKKFFDKKDFHNGFVTIGFDQLLHYLQLYYTFKFLVDK